MHIGRRTYTKEIIYTHTQIYMQHTWEYCHLFVCVEIPSRGSSGSPQMAQAKAIYTKVGVTPSGSTRRYCGPCQVFEQFGDVNPHCCRTGNLGPPLPERVAGSLRLPPDAPPAARAVTHQDVGALFQPGAAIAVCVRPAVPPPMPRPDARNLPSRTAPAHIPDSAPEGRVGRGLA